MSDKPWYLEHSQAMGSAYLHFRNAIHEKSIILNLEK